MTSRNAILARRAAFIAAALASSAGACSDGSGPSVCLSLGGNPGTTDANIGGSGAVDAADDGAADDSASAADSLASEPDGT
jgi:hypothetical protein